MTGGKKQPWKKSNAKGQDRRRRKNRQHPLFHVLVGFVCILLVFAVGATAFFLWMDRKSEQEAENGTDDQIVDAEDDTLEDFSLLYSFSADITSVEVDTKTTVTFTAKVGESLDETDKMIVLYDTDSDAEGDMHDDGLDGDEEAGDGIFTLVLELYEEEAGKHTYCLDFEGTVLGECAVWFYEPLTVEELDALSGAEERFLALTNTADYRSATEETKTEEILAVAGELIGEGVIDGDSVCYFETEKMITFTYSCGVLGGVCLESEDGQKNFRV